MLSKRVSLKAYLKLCIERGVISDAGIFCRAYLNLILAHGHNRRQDMSKMQITEGRLHEK